MLEQGLLEENCSKVLGISHDAVNGHHALDQIVRDAERHVGATEHVEAAIVTAIVNETAIETANATGDLVVDLVQEA